MAVGRRRTSKEVSRVGLGLVLCSPTFSLVPVFNHTCGISYPNFVSFISKPAACCEDNGELTGTLATDRNSRGVFGRSERLRKSLERMYGSDLSRLVRVCNANEENNSWGREK